MARWLAGMIILLPLLIGGNPPSPEANLPNVRDCPFEADPNLVVGKLLACLQVELGEQFVHTRTWYDPDGDPAEVKLLSAPNGVQLIDRSKVASYTILWTPPQLMTAAIVVQVTDKPRSGVPKSDTGTVLVQVVPRKRSFAFGGCGGPSR